ncbi:MAG: DUF3445 domain-containing protein [Acidimicrobiia bacterium]|nr:DUF3445 domain-containing protein [Acidimicrobiia bacterium]
MSAVVPTDSWFGEIDLDPHGAWLRMGTRNLGSRPWLVIDDQRDAELALKRRLLTERPDEVFAAASDADGPGRETLDLVQRELEALGISTSVDDLVEHPLDRAGRLVQEDLCLLRPVDGRWVLAGASLCFPSRWRLAAKFERELVLVHGPVAGYADQLTDRVDRLLNRLGDTVVWRRNWFLRPNSALFQPDRPPNGDPVVPAERCLDELFVRSERQTLRRLPASGWVLFTIRIQQAPVRRFVADIGRRAALNRFLAEAPTDLSGHKGPSEQQCFELANALAGLQA